MDTKSFFTTGDLSRLTSEPEWKVRRVCDALDPPVEKFGNKRMIPATRLAEILSAIADKSEASRDD